MTVYWLLAFAPLIALLSPVRLERRSRNVVWWLMGIAVILLIGLRDKTGGDWYSYDISFARFALLTSKDVLTEFRDPSYYWTGWLLSRVGLTVHALNLICATVLVAGVIRFCRSLPYPWLALFVSMPYLVIVVGMGYTRQSAAIGLLLAALVELARSRTWRYVILVFVAATFHRSAIVMLPIAGLVASKNKWWTLLWVGSITVLGYFAFVVDSYEKLWANYVESEYSNAADGAPLRIAMNALPAFVYLVFVRRRQDVAPAEIRLWVILSLAALACIPLLSLSNTAVDRIALYILPVQLYVASWFVQVTRGRLVRTNLVLAYAAVYMGVLFVWLNFAGNSARWLPYRNVLGGIW